MEPEKTVVMMPKGFTEAFRIVCTHYGCTAEEIEQMQTYARENPDDAARCYFALQGEIERMRTHQEETGYCVSAADMVIEPRKERGGI